jgi:hypothetical protein
MGTINAEMNPSSGVSIMTINLNNGGSSGLVRFGANIISAYRNSDTYTWYSCTSIIFAITNSTSSSTTVQPYSSGANSVLQKLVLEYVRIA